MIIGAAPRVIGRLTKSGGETAGARRPLPAARPAAGSGSTLLVLIVAAVVVGITLIRRLLLHRLA
jgi:hypothetical protein